MSAVDQDTASPPAPMLPGPRVPQRPLTLFQFLRVLRDDTLATIRSEAYTADILERRLLWKRTFFVNEPGAVKHVLLDNAANYHKTEIARRLLEPGLGRGLLTSEGETWRRHRRIMAAAFDHRSIVAYAPIMTDIAENLLRDWDALPAPAETDVATAMMHATLLIIARTMFSSDSDDIVDIVEGGVHRYQAEVRPGLVDILGLPRWLSSSHGAGAIFTEFDKAIDRLIGARGRAGDAQPKDLLARLIAARDEETGG